MNAFSYKNWPSMSDKALMEFIGSFIKHHRLQQDRSQDSLAAEAGISRSTLSLLERGEPVTLPTLIQVLRALDMLHVLEAFTVEEQISPILMAKAEKYKRKRAGKSSTPRDTELDW